jgi:hypothetical protein
MFNRKIIAMQTDWGGEYERLNSFFSLNRYFSSCVQPLYSSTNWCGRTQTSAHCRDGSCFISHCIYVLKILGSGFPCCHPPNKSHPTKLLAYDTPIHCLLGATPDYSNLQVFGCACWPNLRPYNSHKLQFRSIRCVFLAIVIFTKGINA